MPETEKYRPEEERKTAVPEMRPELREQVLRYEAELRELASRYGTDALEVLAMLIDDIREGRNRDESKAAAFELAKEQPDYERGGELFYEFLKSQGAVAELEDGSVVVDLDKTNSLSMNQNFRIYNRFYTIAKSRSLRYGLYAALRGRSGMTLAEYEQGRRSPHKEVLYVPDDEQSAFDIEKIKQADFAFALWDGAKYSKESSYPAKDGRKLNGVAVELAALIYHPKYGAGYRDPETGVLMVRSPKTGEFQPFNKELLVKEFGFNRSRVDPKTGQNYHLRGSTLDYFRNAAPELLKYDLVRLSDTRVISAGEHKSERPIFKPVGSRGVVMINRVLHYVGRNFFDRGEVARIDQSTGAVIEPDQEGKKRITHTFRIFQPSKELLRGKVGPDYYAGAELTNVHLFSEEEFFQRRPGESDDQYRERTQVLRDFDSYIEFSQELLETTGMNIETLPFVQAVHLASFAQAHPERKVVLFRFIEKFGEEGLRTFSSLELGLERGEKILQLSQELPEPIADQIFLKYNEMLNAVDNISGLLKDKKVDISRVRGNLLKKANEVLSGFAEMAEQTEERDTLFTSRLILRQLEKIKSEIILFAATFRVMAEQGEVDFEDVKHTQLEAKDSSELSVSEKQEMMRIFLENRADYPPRLLDNTRAIFERALNKAGSEFFLLYHQDDLVSFIRFDKLPNRHLYAGSLNVRPEAKGSAIGTAMLKATLHKKAEAQTIEAEAWAGNPGLVKYYQDYWGFQIAGEVADWHGSGEKFYELRLPQKIRKAA